MQPKIHYNETKVVDGVLCYRAEISDNAGTHSVYLEKSKVDAKKF